MAHQNTFAGNPLDRAGDLRNDPDWLAEILRAARDARAAGDKALAAAVGKLRKPTVVGWLVNLLARALRPPGVRIT